MSDQWKIFDIPELVEKATKAGEVYREFLRVPDLSCGIYTLRKGAKDLQSPHDEDEVYYVLRGRGRVRIEGDEYEAKPGALLYVQATSEHSFFEVEEDLTLLVFFATGGPSGDAPTG